MTDGFWRCRALIDFFPHIERVDGRTELLGPFDPPGQDEGLGRFLAELRDAMVGPLAELRAEGASG